MTLTLVPTSKEETNLPIKNFSELKDVGSMFEQSGMFGCTKQGQGIVLAMTCVMERMTPLRFMQTYNIIEGRPSMKADAMLAKFREIGGSFKITTRTSDEAKIEMEFKGNKLLSVFTWTEAQNEPFVKANGGGLKKNWSTPRGKMQMLWARAVSDGIRAIAPEINAGIYTPEETADLVEKPEGETSPSVVKLTSDEAKKDFSSLSPVQPPANLKQDSPRFPIVEAEIVEGNEFKTCPVGKNYKGKKWSEIPVDVLKSTLSLPSGKYPELTTGHIEAVKAELKRREGAVVA